ncbi:MAG: tetratricopeptide repeat protein [Planctomycetota bacterium]|nr:tetratricopeptide repeat protein [Planctomycetota bacterium]
MRGLHVKAGLILAVLGAWTVHAASDTVVVKKGEPVQGSVNKDDLDGVEVSIGGGGKMTLDVNDVVEIKWDIATQEWMEGQREIRSGNFADAAAAFQVMTQPEVVRNSGIRPVMLPYIYFLAGDCLYRAGKPQDAANVLREFMTKFPKSRYLPKVTERLVDSAIQSGQFKEVPDLLSKLKGQGAAMAAKATCLEADMLRAQGKADAAAAKYEEAARTAADNETRALAKLGVARCAVEKKDFAKAQQMAEQALDSGDIPVVAATAHLIIGNSLLEQANKATGDAAQELYLDAVIEFLRIPVMYGGDERTEPESLFQAGMCFQRLSKFPSRASDKRRAAGLYVTLIQNYSGSSWAAQARENMKNVR